MDTKECLIVDYYAHNGRKIRSVVDKILKKNFAWITDKEYFYSLANEVFATDILDNYDELKGDFDGWVYFCLNKKLFTGVTTLNRQKRTPYLRDKNGEVVKGEDDKPIRMGIVSIYASVGNDENELTFCDLLPDKNDVESMIFDGSIDINGESKIEKYLNRLSKLQRKIVEMLASGYKPAEIKKILHISDSDYTDNMQSIHAYENVSILY